MSNKIKIYGDVVKGCIFFDGSTVEPKFLGTIFAEIKTDETDRIIIYRTDRQDSLGNNRQLFKRMQPERIQNEDTVDLVSGLGYSIQDVVDYINGQADLTASTNPVINTSLNGLDIDFKLDTTNTSIILDNGYQYGVNTIKALNTGDGLITIKSIQDARVLFTELDYTKVDINGVDAVGGLNDVINVLNELFTVGAFESIVISDPHSTLVADLGGIDTTGGLVGSAINPSGNDIGAGISSHYNKAGYKSTETIDQAGEYFTFNMRNEGIFGACLVLDDIADAQGNLTYADPTKFCDGVTNTGNMGIQWGMFFHPSPNGPWTYYGAQSGTVYGSGWNGADAFRYSNDGANWLAGNAEEFRIGIDANSFISMEYYDNDNSAWVVVSRTNYPVGNNVKFHLGIKFCDSTVRLVDNPKVHLLESAAPTMYFRYIESPDGNYEYPLFVTEEESNYYDLNNGGTGTSHTHTYVDDPTNTTWYMPDNGATMTETVVPSGAYLTFLSNPVTYTEITSLTDSDLTPSAFTFDDISQEEGTSVNLQLYPAGASFSQSATISPNTSGLVYNTSTHYLQGTLTDVGADTVYTVTVIRANSYGSTTSTFTITATDVPVASTNDTPWSKAIDFGSSTNEYLKMIHSATAINALRMGGVGQTVNANTQDTNKTSDSTYARPWATTVVFKANSTHGAGEYIWNSGNGSANHMHNIAVRLSSNHLYFSWGKDAYQTIAYIAGPLDPNEWHGLYIAHKGQRYSGTTGSSALLADAFDIRLMSSADNFSSIGSNLSTSGAWVSTSNMATSITGSFTVGGQYDTKSFNGKVASLVVTTLELNRVLPSDDEIKVMITDPVKWLADYKVGNDARQANSNQVVTFAMNTMYSYYATQVWLMGDGVNDSYTNGVRNEVYIHDQGATKLSINNMVSNDIENVTIAGLS